MTRPESLSAAPGHAPAALIANQQPGRRNPNRGKKFPVEVLTQSEARELLQACSAERLSGIRNRAVLAVLYRTGLRCSECLALYPHDVDLERGAVTVLRGKGAKRRTVGIDDQAAELLRQWLDARRRAGVSPHAPLFCTLQGPRPGHALSTSYLRELLPALARKAGIDKRVHPHGMRHTHAYELCLERVPHPIIQKQLGHSKLETTARYLDHFAPEQVISAMRERSWDLNGGN